jgi:fatty-acyl-CoA synthase
MLPYRTVVDAIVATGQTRPGHGYTFQDMKGRETFYSFADLDRETSRRANGLLELGLKRGDRVGLVIIEPEDFVLTFLATLRAGIVSAPFYPPMGLANYGAYHERMIRLMKNCGARVLVASKRMAKLLWSLVDDVEGLERVVTPDQLVTRTPLTREVALAPSDLAFLQYTSGSTRLPKGVMVTHGSLVANSWAILGPQGLQCNPDVDSGASWLPLYHDMGLVGFVVAPICFGASVVFIPTLRFLQDPTVWLDTIDRFRASVSFGPNFAFGYTARRIRQDQLERWDLSCLKVLGCGGEPIRPDTLRHFSDLLVGPTKMHPNVVRPCYGSAESTLAIALVPLSEGLQVREVDAESFQTEGRVLPPRPDRPTLQHVACGVAVAGTELAIVDSEGRPVEDGIEGEILVRGPSVAAGYHQDPESTVETFREGWLHTGDFGYLLDGQIYVTGRKKDLLILRGRNYHPHELEFPLESIDGVRRGNIVAFSVPGEESEEVVIVLESKDEPGQALLQAVKAQVQMTTGLYPKDIVVLRPNTLPKTSSGKAQRSTTRELYLNGLLGQQSTRVNALGGNRLELVDHFVRSMWLRLRTSLTSSGRDSARDPK